MRPLALLSLLTLVAAPSYLSAAPPLEALVIKQLRCTTPPNPLPILEQLEKMGKIDPNQMDSMDSISCFPLAGGISIAGFTFQSICAFEDDATIRAKRPDLLVRAPGTAPGQMISFGTDAALTELTQWYVAAIGPKHESRAFEGADETLDGKTHVTCNAWFAQ